MYHIGPGPNIMQ